MRGAGLLGCMTSLWIRRGNLAPSIMAMMSDMQISINVIVILLIVVFARFAHKRLYLSDM